MAKKNATTSKLPVTWLEADFRNAPEKSGLPAHWQDTSKTFGTQAGFQVIQEKGVRFLRLEAMAAGKVQIRLPLKQKFNQETAFRVTFLGRSSTNAGVLMGVRKSAQPQQADEVDAAVLLSLSPAWKEHVVTTRGGPVKGPVAFYLNFGVPGRVDILRIKVEQIAGREHTPLPVVPRGHEELWDGGWLETHEGMRLRARENKPVIGYWGDSITAGWLNAGKTAWKRDFAPLNAMNFGIGGDTVQTVHWRLCDARVGQDFSPRLVVLMIGSNNLFHIDSPVDVADGMALLLKQFRLRLPGSTVLLLGVTPSRHDPKDGLRKRIAELNRRYAKLADGKKVIFADVGRALLEKDGSLSRSVSADGTHFLAEGYERLAGAIMPLIHRILPATSATRTT